jgi:endonuclease-3
VPKSKSARAKQPRAPARPATQARTRRATAKPASKSATPASANPARIWERLHEALPDPRCELNHADAWQLLVATILSAQSTDARVNQVTPTLFRTYATPAALGSAEPSDVEALVRSTGFFRNKAKAIIGASRMIAERHRGTVPHSMEALMELPGVARKTANLVLGTAYGIASGVIVDTHAGRVARRLGLSEGTEPEQVERDLCSAFPARDWVALGHSLVLHGRYVCTARKPECSHCPLQEVCPSAESVAAESLSQRVRWERGKVPGPASTRGAHG